jgi:uncharacterized membrane protein YkoI
MRVFMLACVAVPFALQAADLPCSIKAKSSMPHAEMTSAAKLSDDAARKLALERVKAKGAAIKSGGLEVEDGCLLYTYDVKVPGRKGYEEVYIDAGTGAVLKVGHESDAKEKAEHAADKLKAQSPK